MAKRRQRGEGSLYRRKDGLWVAVANDGWRDGKRQRRQFTSLDYGTALEKRREFTEARRDGFTMPKGRPPYVGEWMLHWLHNVAKARVEATTWHKSYRQKTEELIVPYFERVPLPELDEEMIEAWHRQLERRISERTGQRMAPGTIGQAHRILSAALKVAVVRGKMPRNPCSNVTPPRLAAAELAPPAADEARALMARCETWPNGARWILAMTTGLRQGEALALEWQHVRLADPASVRVAQSAARVAGERIVKPPKSARSRRTVPLPPVAVDALRAHRASGVRSIDGLVFTTARGRPVDPSVDRRDWARLLADLGLPHYRVHDLRHGYATMLLESGTDPRVVQELLGHSSVRLLSVYQHVRPVLHERAADAVQQALGKRL
jgi:integrase